MELVCASVALEELVRLQTLENGVGVLSEDTRAAIQEIDALTSMAPSANESTSAGAFLISSIKSSPLAMMRYPLGLRRTGTLNTAPLYYECADISGHQ
jgi:hypothetical protein